MNKIANEAFWSCWNQATETPEIRALIMAQEAEVSKLEDSARQSVDESAWAVIEECAKAMFMAGWQLGRNPDQLFELPLSD